MAFAIGAMEIMAMCSSGAKFGTLDATESYTVPSLLKSTPMAHDVCHDGNWHPSIVAARAAAVCGVLCSGHFGSRSQARALGTPARWKTHRQAATAQKALASGYQLKRGAVKPLLEVELEPGQAIQWALQVDHPFTLPAALDQDLESAIMAVMSAPAQVLLARVTALAFWEREALRLLPESIARIRALPDRHLRALLLGGSDSAAPVWVVFAMWPSMKQCSKQPILLMNSFLTTCCMVSLSWV